MELTTSELLALKEGIRNTADMSLPAEHSVDKRVNDDRITPLIRATGEEEKQKRKEYADEVDAQGNIEEISDESADALRDEIANLMNKTHEVELRKIPWNVIRTYEISDRNLAQLRPMISGLPEEYEAIFERIDTQPDPDE